MVYLPGAGKIRKEPVTLRKEKVEGRFAQAALPDEMSAQVVLEQIAAGADFEIKIHGPTQEIAGLYLCIRGNVYGGERPDVEQAFPKVLEACRSGNYKIHSKIEGDEIELEVRIPFNYLKPQ